MLIDGRSPLTSDALPFEIGSFRTGGTLTNYDAFLKGAKAETSQEHSGEQHERLPLHRTINDFR